MLWLGYLPSTKFMNFLAFLGVIIILNFNIVLIIDLLMLKNLVALNYKIMIMKEMIYKILAVIRSLQQ